MRSKLVNIGPIDEGVTVRNIAGWVVKRISPDALIKYGEGDKGCVGDVSKFSYSTKHLHSYGWTPKLDSGGAVTKAINVIALQLGQ